MIDAGEHQVWLLLHQFEQGQLHAVGGGATAGPGGDPWGEQFIGPLGADGGLQGEAMACGRPFLIRADHRHLMAAGCRCGGQGSDAVGEDPIVIADQDPQRGHGVIRTEVNLSGTAAYSRQLSVPSL